MQATGKMKIPLTLIPPLRNDNDSRARDNADKVEASGNKKIQEIISSDKALGKDFIKNARK